MEGTLPSYLENKTGLKQGDTLSPTLLYLALQKVTHGTQMVPSGTKGGREQLNVSACADGIVVIGTNEIEIRKLL